MTEGQILHLQRLSTEDGPGIRTTIFFKGCPLACEWCHNPECISRHAELQWFSARCLGCGTCLESCSSSSLALTDEGMKINRDTCSSCGNCAQACPSGALEILGKSISSRELVEEIEKDRAYYEKSGGGVTLSGGEPTFQPAFAESILRALKQVEISTALDTCGLTSRDILKQLLPHCDLILFDIKILDRDLHKHYTGHSNDRILENLLFIRDHLRGESTQKRLWIRTPLIPLATDTESNLSGIGAFISSQLSEVIDRWDLCAFNNLCRDQYTRLGLRWKYSTAPLMTKEELSRCEEIAKRSVFDASIVHATGATRVPA